MRRALVIGLGVALLATGVPASALAVVSVPTAPPPVQRAALTQAGQMLVWSLTMRTPFSPAHLAREHRELCLLFDSRGGRALGRLCVVGPARGSRAPRLAFARAPGGQFGLIAAQLSRGSDRELTASFLPSAVGLSYRPLRWQVLSALTTSMCRLSSSPACVTVLPHRPARVSLHVPLLVGCVAAGPSFVSQGSPGQRTIALTFDDGPWPDTPQFLSVLERAHVVATFFEIGDQVAEYGQGGAIERRILADGDMLGDHTWNHADVAGGGPFAASELLRAAAALRAATGGFQPCLFRAPYGAVSPGLIGEARSLGFLTIQWDVDPRDWARPGAGAIYQNVVDNARPGAIVIQHDGGGDRSETLAALPREIATLKAEGYRLVTVADLLGLRLIYK